MHTFFLLLALAVGGADVYRWTDGDGQVHYSDRPHPGAEKVVIDVAPPAADDSAPEPAVEPSATGEEEPAPIDRYAELTITSPGQEEVLWNIEGQLDVAAAVQPALQPGHSLDFVLDGNPTRLDPGETRTRLSGVFRGEHTLRAEIVDAAGQTLVSSPVTTFFVRQTSIANAAPPPGPTPRPRPRPGP